MGTTASNKEAARPASPGGAARRAAGGRPLARDEPSPGRRTSGRPTPLPELHVVVLAEDPRFAQAVRAACGSEPGAWWRVSVAGEDPRALEPFDALVLEAAEPGPRAALRARWRHEAALRGVSIREVEPSADVRRSLRALRLARTPLDPPEARDTAWPPRQQSLALERHADRTYVRLPPTGPVVSVVRLASGVRLETRESPRRSMLVRWGRRGVVVHASGIDLHVPGGLDPLAIRTCGGDPFSRFADELAGPSGLPRALLEPAIRLARCWFVRLIGPAARRAARALRGEARAELAARLRGAPARLP